MGDQAGHYAQTACYSGGRDLGIIDYHSPLNILISVKGHPYERDAFAAVGLPFIEVHLSNVHAREPFRQKSFFSDLAHAVLCGLGPRGYAAAVDAALEQSGFRTTLT